MSATGTRVPVRGPLLAAACATFVGIGVARFSYGPMLPEMVQSGWLSPGAAGILGAANLAGYLGGALLAPSLSTRVGTIALLRAAMLLTAVSMGPCAVPLGFYWFLPWRILAGITAGILMALVGPTVQSALPVQVRGLAAGFLFGGVGTGSVVGALLVPALLPAGLSVTWLVLGAVCLGGTLVAWPLWPKNPPPVPPRPAAGLRWPPAALALVGCYALCGVAASPHMQWWPDFLARGLGLGTAAGARSWLIWSVAAAGAPVLFGRLADRIGGFSALLFALAIQITAVLLPLFLHAPAALLASVVFAGATATGLSALVLTRSRELAGGHAGRLWSLCTSCYGASQTGAGFFLAWLYTLSGSHLPLFFVGLLAGGIAVLLVKK